MLKNASLSVSSGTQFSERIFYISSTAFSTRRISFSSLNSVAIPSPKQSPQTKSLTSSPMFSASTQVYSRRVYFFENEPACESFRDANEKLHYALKNGELSLVISALEGDD